MLVAGAAGLRVRAGVHHSTGALLVLHLHRTRLPAEFLGPPVARVTAGVGTLSGEFGEGVTEAAGLSMLRRVVPTVAHVFNTSQDEGGEIQETVTGAERWAG